MTGTAWLCHRTHWPQRVWSVTQLSCQKGGAGWEAASYAKHPLTCAGRTLSEPGPHARCKVVRGLGVGSDLCSGVSASRVMGASDSEASDPCSGPRPVLSVWAAVEAGVSGRGFRPESGLGDPLTPTIQKVTGHTCGGGAGCNDCEGTYTS